jgi:hypothetical protein
MTTFHNIIFQLPVVMWCIHKIKNNKSCIRDGEMVKYNYTIISVEVERFSCDHVSRLSMLMIWVMSELCIPGNMDGSTSPNTGSAIKQDLWACGVCQKGSTSKRGSSRRIAVWIS